jgi:hypothetical protein
MVSFMTRSVYLRKKVPVQHWLQGCADTGYGLCMVKRETFFSFFARQQIRVFQLKV